MRSANYLTAILRDEQGATAIEYGLIVALIVIAMMAALGTVADTTIDMWDEVEEKVVEAKNA